MFWDTFVEVEVQELCVGSSVYLLNLVLQIYIQNVNTVADCKNEYDVATYTSHIVIA